MCFLSFFVCIWRNENLLVFVLILFTYTKPRAQAVNTLYEISARKVDHPTDQVKDDSKGSNYII